MRWRSILDRFVQRPPARRATNSARRWRRFSTRSQSPLVTGLIGPAINPSLEPTLDVARRAGLVLGGVAAHLVVRAILWSVEDK
jgi:hypothetical protein